MSLITRLINMNLECYSVIWSGSSHDFLSNMVLEWFSAVSYVQYTCSVDLAGIRLQSGIYAVQVHWSQFFNSNKKAPHKAEVKIIPLKNI